MTDDLVAVHVSEILAAIRRIEAGIRYGVMQRTAGETALRTVIQRATESDAPDVVAAAEAALDRIALAELSHANIRPAGTA